MVGYQEQRGCGECWTSFLPAHHLRISDCPDTLESQWSSSNCLGYLVSMMLKLSSNWWEYVDSFTPSNTPSPSKPPAMVYYNLKGLFPPSASLMFKGFKGDSLIIYFSNGKAAKQVVDKISEVNPPHLLKSARRTQTTKALASATSLDPIHPYFSETFTKITRCLRNTTIKRKH